MRSPACQSMPPRNSDNAEDAFIANAISAASQWISCAIKPASSSMSSNQLRKSAQAVSSRVAKCAVDSRRGCARAVVRTWRYSATSSSRSAGNSARMADQFIVFFYCAPEFRHDIRYGNIARWRDLCARPTPPGPAPTSLPTVIRYGTPIRSASLNFTPGRSSRSS